MINDVLQTLAALEVSLRPRSPRPPASFRERIIARGHSTRWRRRLNPVRLTGIGKS